MCATCGCSSDGGDVVVDHEHADPHDHEHTHPHDHEHTHPHDHEHTHPHDHEGGGATETVTLEQRVLARNDLGAARNRGWFEGRGIVALNLMSSPGAGKTTLLVRTITDLTATRPVAVIEGDQETSFDAERIRATGAPVVQLNTGTGCHLDAEMVAQGLDRLDPPPGSVVLIENVGNLVCPALFDLGETARVVITSVTEGDDKPLKYPHMFRSADLLVLNKVDLLPHVEFDVGRCTAAARRLAPALEVLTVSATRGDGLDGWYDWLSVRGGWRRPQPAPR